jgi:hypothetical protein
LIVDGGVGAVEGLGDDLLVDDAADFEAERHHFAQGSGIEGVVFRLLVDECVRVGWDVDE